MLGVEIGVAKVEISIFSGKGSIGGLTVANPADYDSPHAITIDNVYMLILARLVQTRYTLRQ